jgi:aminoglycoside phosphotransferase (APT) family kinase protein
MPPVVVRSSGSQLVSTSEAREALRAAGISCTSISPVAEQGWASDVFEVDGGLIARFPRNAQVAAGHAREQRLLPALASFVSFRVPVPLTEDVFVYERIEGRGFEVGDDAERAFAMIDELHSFPVDEARRLIGRPPIAAEYAIEWAMFSDEAFPHLDPALVELVDFVRDPPSLERETLIHNDLGVEHIIVDGDGRPVGIIDFEDVTIGDPAVDRMPLTVELGRPLDERMWRYHVRGTLHAISFFHREGRFGEIPAVVAELRRRLDLRPGR